MATEPKNARAEKEIFDDLGELCSSPGYVHVVAYLCMRDSMVRYSGEIEAKDLVPLFSSTHLVRTEISTLVGLMLKSEIGFGVPPPHVMQRYIDQTEALLEEIHHCLSRAWLIDFEPIKAADKDFNPFTSGQALREPIFYGGESAYSFQYRDLSLKKYGKDDDWLKANKGFSIQTARDVIHAIGKLLEVKAVSAVENLKVVPPEQWTLLPGRLFTAGEVPETAGLEAPVVEVILGTFSVQTSERNEEFRALNDFNVANASPLLRTPDGNYMLFHLYSLVEALYESPFYWMGMDKAYVNTAMRHRGEFTEEFSAERLVAVFGKENVHTNVDIFESKNVRVGEIDVLVVSEIARLCCKLNLSA